MKLVFIAAFSALFIISCSPSTMILHAPGQPVIKSPNDPREYKTLTLPNQLEVLLVSDPERDEAAVSLDIKTGQINDPVTRQGIAHFLEHMLFLGNEKYPEPEEFGRFLSAHGGYSNAYTAFEDTNFFFEIQDDYLEGALDRFVQFFISPTFDPQFVEREINAVNSEHNKNIKDDRRRIFRVLKEVSNPQHPFHQFATGNLETLKGGDDDYQPLQRALITYFEENYSSNRMKLVVISKDSIPKLEGLVMKYFSAIENKGLNTEYTSQIPIIADPLPRVVTIEPIKAMRQLRLQFPMPSYRKHYRYKPGSVVSQLLGDEGEGSVLSYLKQKGWATSLSAGIGFSATDFSFFGIEISLTPEGINHVDEIVRTVFQYVDLIKKEEDLAGYYLELKQMAEIGFRFKEQEDAIDYARNLAATMQEVPGHEAVISRWLYEEYRPDLVSELLGFLTVENLQVVQIAPGSRVNQTEKWYGVNYAVEPVGQKTQAAWKTDAANSSLSLPKPNPFIPSNIELHALELKERYPILLQDTEAIRIWYKQDDRFRVPKGNIQIQMSSRLAYQTVENAAMTKLFTLMLSDHLNEFSYPATLAGLNYSLSNSINGLNININGYSENLMLLLRKIVEGMTGFKPERAKFEIFKNQIKERRQNQKLSQAYQRITYESYYLLTNPLWHTDDYLASIDQVTMEKLTRFIPLLLSQMKIEVLCHGNFKVHEAKEIGALLVNHFTQPELPPAEEVEERTLVIPVSPDYVYQVPVEDINSAIELHYQAGPKSLKKTVALDMIQQILEKPFYHQLRTIEQLGYLVWSGSRQINKVEGFYFIIQSGLKDPVYLQDRIEAFLRQFQQSIENITIEEFDKFRESLVSRRLEAPKNLGEETYRYWSQIAAKSYDFDFLEMEAGMLKQLQIEDVIETYNSVFINPETERKISIQGFGKKHEIRPAKGQMIDDVKVFKSKMESYPNPQGKIRSRVFAN